VEACVHGNPGMATGGMGDVLSGIIGALLAQGFAPADLDGAETRDITLPIGGQPMTFKGQDYLVTFALPNFYFHAATAYAILRHCGVAIGKRDFMART
jgi:hypothetical protein